MLASGKTTQSWRSPHASPCRHSPICVQAELIRNSLPPCLTEHPRDVARPVYESGRDLVEAFMKLTAAFEEARGEDGQDAKLQSFIDTAAPSADRVAVDVAIVGYHKDVSKWQKTRKPHQCGTCSCDAGLGRPCCNSCKSPQCRGESRMYLLPMQACIIVELLGSGDRAFEHVPAVLIPCFHALLQRIVQPDQLFDNYIMGIKYKKAPLVPSSRSEGCVSWHFCSVRYCHGNEMCSQLLQARAAG